MIVNTDLADLMQRTSWSARCAYTSANCDLCGDLVNAHFEIGLYPVSEVGGVFWQLHDNTLFFEPDTCMVHICTDCLFKVTPADWAEYEIWMTRLNANRSAYYLVSCPEVAEIVKTAKRYRMAGFGLIYRDMITRIFNAVDRTKEVSRNDLSFLNMYISVCKKEVLAGEEEENASRS